MSLEAMTQALSADVGDPTRKLLLIAMANHAHKDGTNSWAAKSTLADYVGCDPKTVARQWKALLRDGWIRHGDQAQVAHIRADRRPIVFDLAMTDEIRAEWAAAATEPTTERGDTLSPRSDDHEGTPTGSRATLDGGTHGGTNPAPRGDMAVSPEPSTNLGTSPQPPEPSGRRGPTPPACRRHTNPVDNCRGCGTTARQLEAAATRRAAEDRRLRDQVAAAESRARRQAVDPDTYEAGAHKARQAMKAGAR